MINPSLGTSDDACEGCGAVTTIGVDLGRYGSEYQRLATMCVPCARRLAVQLALLLRPTQHAQGRVADIFGDAT